MIVYDLYVVCKCCTAFTHVTFTYTRVIEAAAKKQAQLQAKKDAAESECHVYFIFMMLNYLVQHSRRSSYNQFVEATAKRDAQLQAKKDADEKRRLAADGE